MRCQTSKLEAVQHLQVRTSQARARCMNETNEQDGGFSRSLKVGKKQIIFYVKVLGTVMKYS